MYGLHETVATLAFAAGRSHTTIQDALAIPEDDPYRRVVRLEKEHNPDLMETASLLVLVAMVGRGGR